MQSGLAIVPAETSTMPGRTVASRDLRLGLLALESGAIDEEQLASAIRAWARSPDRSLAEILSTRRALDAATLARLQDQVTKVIEPGEGDQPSATVAYVSPVRTEKAAANHDIGGWRFEVVRPHARGGLGEVFLAFDRELNRTVALKELQARLAHDPVAQDRFLVEAEVTGRLEHPGIVPVYSLGRYADGRPYYAMRLIEGETLRDAIERFHRGNAEGRELAFRRLLRCVIDACNAVAYAHSRGVVHRDIKPENIMLGRFGETLVVDWGVAKALSSTEAEESEPPPARRPSMDASMTQPGSLIGTPRYMSPEQAAGDLSRVGPASDIYSLGATLYCVLVGHSPFPEGDVDDVIGRVRRGIFPAPRRLRRSTDPALEAICLKAMAPDPQARHATALDLANELEAWLADVRYRGEQEVALSQVQTSLTRLCLERAHNGFGREQHAEGMLWLARALQNAPAEPPELRLAIRTSLSGWHAGSKLLEKSLSHGGEVHDLAFCPEGRRLATADGNRLARLWDLSTGSLFAPPMAHDGAVRAVAFSPDGTLVATAGDDGKVRRWDAVTGARLGDPLALGGPVVALRYSPDGSRIAALAAPGRLLLWDAEMEETALTLTRGEARVLAVGFAPDGAIVAAASESGETILWDTATGQPLGEPIRQASAVLTLAFDPSGRWLLTGCLDGKARLWDVARREALTTLSHQGAVHCVGFRPQSETIATASGDRTARLWDAATGYPIGEPLAHRASVERLAFLPDGSMVATGSVDGTARLWSASTGLPIGPPLSHAGALRTLIFSHDGRRLATASADGSARCWNVPKPVEGEVERISAWVSILTDLEFDEGDAVRKMDGATSWSLRRRLIDLGGPPLR